MWNVTFITYSGMPIYLAEGVDLDEAKEIIRHQKRKAKKLGIPVTKLEKGEWEFQTPDDSHSISDNEGFLSVRRKKARRRR